MKRRKIIITILFVLTLMLSLVACDNGGSNNNKQDEFVYREIDPDEYAADTYTTHTNGYQLVWTEEFNYEGKPDASKWNYEVGGGGWGNNESQVYTNEEKNAYVSDGALKITVLKEGSGYTSARITTKNKGDWKYGLMEIKAKIPTGVGTWPAIWMMPTESKYGGWPRSGEIDIMETTGRRPTYIQGTVHTTNSGSAGAGGATTISNSTTEWNRYQIEWTDKYIKFMVNDQPYYTYYHITGADTNSWPFDQKFFFILNIAMGGNMGGAIDSDFEEAHMLVDYVRVYQPIDETDNEKPTSVNISEYVPGYNKIALTWDKAQDNQGIKQYDIVLNNKIIGATVSNSYVIGGLKEDTTYNVKIVSVDYNGNWTLSSGIDIKTLSMAKIPGKVYGHQYTLSSQKLTVSYASGDGMAIIPSNTEVTFDVKASKATSSNLTLRLVANITSLVKIEILSGGTIIYDSSQTVNQSFGKFIEVAFPTINNLPGGEITIKLTCNASTTGNAIKLNYIEVQ